VPVINFHDEINIDLPIPTHPYEESGKWIFIIGLIIEPIGMIIMMVGVNINPTPQPLLPIHPQPQIMYLPQPPPSIPCGKCGRPMALDNKFCPSCGAPK
jgi:hypothetical protein